MTILINICGGFMIYNDEQLASTRQMEQMAKAYKDHLLKTQTATQIENIDTISHLFNEAGCLANKLLTKASGKKSKQTFTQIHDKLLSCAKTFYSTFATLPQEEVITSPKNFMKSAKRLALCQIELITNLMNLNPNKVIEEIINNILTNIKLLVEIA